MEKPSGSVTAKEKAVAKKPKKRSGTKVVEVRPGAKLRKEKAQFEVPSLC